MELRVTGSKNIKIVKRHCVIAHELTYGDLIDLDIFFIKGEIPECSLTVK